MDLDLKIYVIDQAIKIEVRITKHLTHGVYDQMSEEVKKNAPEN
jgi:hypothetical protein